VKNEWDVLIISGNICPPFQPIGDFCVRLTNCQCCTGYIVQQHYYDTLIANFREGITKLLSDPTNKREFAVDMYWKRLQPKDRWYMIVPPTVVQVEGFSDIEKRETNYKHLMTDMNKEWLFRPRHNIQQNPIQQGFDLGIKYRNPFDLVNGKLNLPNTK
jgi:hypothetical protein